MKQILEGVILEYRKNPKNSDTRIICCNHSKIRTRCLYHRVIHPKDAEGIANSVAPDALFALTYLSENLGTLRY